MSQERDISLDNVVSRETGSCGPQRGMVVKTASEGVTARGQRKHNMESGAFMRRMKERARDREGKAERNQK